MTTDIQEYIDENCYYLSFEEILKLDKHDNGAVNNVITGLEKQCYGITLIDDGLDENYHLFYINGSTEISGLLFKLNFHNTNRNKLTFAFAKIVNDAYSADTDLLGVFNTLQMSTRTILEKLNYLTYGNELAKKKGIIMAKGKLGFHYVPTFNKLEAFKSFFKYIDMQDVDMTINENWIYLILNPRNGYTKIGRSKNPRTREKTLQGEDPENQIIAIWKTSKTIEGVLHKKYRSKRIRGEWFNLDIADLIEISEFMTKEQLHTT